MMTWIVVADGSRAHILQSKNPHHGFEQVESLDWEDGRKMPHELVTDKPGRAFSSYGAGRSAMEPHVDPQSHAKQVFAHTIAELLAQRQERFDRLVLIAPPRMLGEIRACLDDNVSAKITAELHKDLTYLPAHDLSKQLSQVMAV